MAAKKANDKNEIIRRLKIAEGHVRKIRQMTEEGKYCIDILQQTSAVRSSIKKIEEMLLDNHMHHCVINAIKKDKSEEAINEVLEVFRKANK